VTKARRVLTGHGTHSDSVAGVSREAVPLARARLLLHQGRNADARALLDEVIALAEASDRQGRVIEALVLRALANDALGDESAALDDLRRAVTLAAPEGFVRVFLDAGPRMAKLLYRAGSPAAHRLLEAFPPAIRERSAIPSELSEPLSERERDILRLMARGLTYRQIASELMISINTVRYHVKSLYSKLQVSSRTLALARARDLHLLDGA